MIPYIGDFAEDSSVVHYFNTFDSNDPSASVTITNLADADLKVHKDGSVTDIVTDGATIVIDFDSITGTHKVTIDTSVHADYATGADYMVRMEGTTVDGATINAALFTFSIENRYNDVNVVTVSGTAQTAGDIPALVTTVDTVVDGIQTDLDNATDGLGAIKAETALIVQDTNELQVDDVPGLIAALNNISTAQVNAEVDTALADIHLDHLLAVDYDPAAKPGTATALLNEMVEDDAGVSRFTVNALENGPSGSGASASAIADAVWDEAQSGHTTAGTFGKYLDTEVSGVSGGGGLTAQEVRDAMKLAPTAGAPSAGSVDDHLDDVLADTGELQANQGNWLTVTGHATEAKQDIIDTNVDAILVDTSTTIPADIAALNDIAATDIVSAGAITTLAGAIVNVDLVDTTTTNTDMRGTDSAALATELAKVPKSDGTSSWNATALASINAECDTAMTDYDAATGTELASVDSKIDTIDTNIDSILVDTSTTLPSLIDDLAVKKNATFSNFEFLMVLTSDHATPATGLTVTGQRSIDGAAFATVGGTIAEVSNGIYQFDALAADTNGDLITWRFSSATADDTFVTFKTVA